MKTKLALLALVSVLVSCATRPIEDGNPIDRRDDFKSAGTLHEENVQAITGNPGYSLPASQAGLYNVRAITGNPGWKPAPSKP
jgi:hypothetical protein